MSLQNLWQVKKLALNSKSGFNSILFNEKSAAGRLMDFFMSNGKKKASAPPKMKGTKTKGTKRKVCFPK